MMSIVRIALVSAILLAPLPVVAADASIGLKSKMKQMMQQNPEVMQEIMSNPNHRLAMGYRDNLVNFAHLLKNAAQAAETLPGNFVGATAEEMRRSADLLEKRHNDVLQGMSAKNKAMLGEIPKLMHEHLADVRQRLDHLDQLAKADQVLSKEVLKDIDAVIVYCQMGMKGGDYSRMPPHHSMSGSSGNDPELERLVQRMNQVPDSEKIGLMAEILTRMVEKQRGMAEPMQGMPPYDMHPMLHQQMNPQVRYPNGMNDDTDINGDMDDVVEFDETE